MPYHPVIVETAARQLCHLRGIDPDALVSHGAQPSPDGYVPAVLLHSPAWQLAAVDVRNFLCIQAACEYARGRPAPLPYPDATPP